MNKVRIYEWAKQHNKRSSEIVKGLQNCGHKVRNHTSLVDEKLLNSLFLDEKNKEETREITSVKHKNNFSKQNNKKTTNNKNNDNKPKRNNTQATNNDKKIKSGPKKNNKPNNYKEKTVSKPAEPQINNSNKNQKNKQHQEKFDRFAEFDKKENAIFDHKTRTQIKKEARLLREKELKEQTTIVKWSDDMTVSKFATSINIPASDIIAKLFDLGILATLNQPLNKESAEILCTDYNVEIVEDDSNQEYEFDNLIPIIDDKDRVKRPPIVTIMGHVDHGKTTLLDYIRNTEITAKEYGGITQHIGAYQITHKDKEITFLDTPGHAAFSAMRARGANITDITILVVAADDGVMPQTKEALAHAQEAKTPLIVAINKMDKPEANPERVMSELAELNVLAEEWGGETPFIKISARTGEGIDELLDYIDIIADMHDYKAASDAPAYGTVIEANLDKGCGPIATILVEEGTLNLGDSIVIGHTWGTIRKMEDDFGQTFKTAKPSQPVQIMGLKAVPNAGDKFVVLKNAKEAQLIGEKRSEIFAQKTRNAAQAMNLEELNMKIAEGSVKELPVLIKADVQGSVEALASSLEDIEINGVKVRIVYKAVGAINESDVMLASTSNAILIGFNVRPDNVAKSLIESEHVELLLNNVIYKIIEEIEDSMNGMRDKKYREEIIGYADVLEIFKISGVGKVLGANVTEGKITRDSCIRLIRDGIVVYDGEIGQLKRHKDEVKEVVAGQDCGISFRDFDDVKKGDQIESYILEEEII